MNIIKSFEKNGKSLEVYGTYDKPLFQAKQIGKSLGFDCIRSTLRNMNAKWKVARGMHTPGGVQQMTFLTEPGLYYLVMRSTKKSAKDFQEWVVEDVLPSIRRTGKYEMDNEPIRKRLTFKIENEYDLHTKVVNFINNYYPQALTVATLGELQDTVDKRIKSKKCGYMKGSPDIVINNLHKHYRGLAIELKTPKGNGTVSEHQTKMLKKFKDNGFKTLLTNDYDECIITVIEYMKDIRIACKYCNRKFKCDDSRRNHYEGFHKISKS